MTSASPPTVATVFVREMQEGCEIDQVLLVRGGRLRQARRRRVPQGRRSAIARAPCAAMVWDDVAAPARAVPGRLRRSTSSAASRSTRATARRSRSARCAPPPTGTFDARRPARRPAARRRRDGGRPARARRHRAGPAPARACSTACFGEGTETWARYRERAGREVLPPGLRATACSSTALSVAQGVSAISATFPGIDRDVAVTGALLHDIGKLEAYTADPRRDRPDRRRPAPGRDPARLLPRPARDRGPRRASRPSSRRRVLHIILSHHGSLEHGSPVVPCTREATLVHMIDNLGGRLGSLRPAREGARAGRRAGPRSTARSAAAPTSARAPRGARRRRRRRAEPTAGSGAAACAARARLGARRGRRSTPRLGATRRGLVVTPATAAPALRRGPSRRPRLRRVAATSTALERRVLGSQAARRHGRECRGGCPTVERPARVERDRVGVADDARALERLGRRRPPIPSPGQVDEQQVVVGAAGDEVEAAPRRPSASAAALATTARA